MTDKPTARELAEWLETRADLFAPEYEEQIQMCHAAAAELDRLAEKDSWCSLGVGDGTGKLFVHGDYDSIKAAQEIILERDRLREIVAAPDGYITISKMIHDRRLAEINRLREALRVAALHFDVIVRKAHRNWRETASKWAAEAREKAEGGK